MYLMYLCSMIDIMTKLPWRERQRRRKVKRQSKRKSIQTNKLLTRLIAVIFVIHVIIIKRQ